MTSGLSLRLLLAGPGWTGANETGTETARWSTSAWFFHVTDALVLVSSRRGSHPAGAGGGLQGTLSRLVARPSVR